MPAKPAPPVALELGGVAIVKNPKKPNKDDPKAGRVAVYASERNRIFIRAGACHIVEVTDWLVGAVSRGLVEVVKASSPKLKSRVKLFKEFSPSEDDEE